MKVWEWDVPELKSLPQAACAGTHRKPVSTATRLVEMRRPSLPEDIISFACISSLRLISCSASTRRSLRTLTMAAWCLACTPAIVLTLFSFCELRQLFRLRQAIPKRLLHKDIFSCLQKRSTVSRLGYATYILLVGISFSFLPSLDLSFFISDLSSHIKWRHMTHVDAS